MLYGISHITIDTYCAVHNYKFISSMINRNNVWNAEIGLEHILFLLSYS